MELHIELHSGVHMKLHVEHHMELHMELHMGPIMLLKGGHATPMGAIKLPYRLVYIWILDPCVTLSYIHAYEQGSGMIVLEK